MADRNDWSVNVPMSDLIRIFERLEAQDKTDSEVKQIRNEIDGLRGMFRELMDALGEIRRSQDGR